ncbi:RES domain-containing protein [Streptomyces sp. NBC_00320]|uniref:RES domain-containing protein n=1 Tax=unclassified Streptomyces TaxID=2593676 RepID=UPI00224D77CD|nr:RES domain-containing protein [Streptomyces sp. NBC_00320]MCX5151476.1 RES domain-containing protein [Streptomyces sp. NBC_00320]
MSTTPSRDRLSRRPDRPVGPAAARATSNTGPRLAEGGRSKESGRMSRDTVQPDVVLVPAPDHGVWRLGKAKNPVKYERISQEDWSRTGGNRWSLVSYDILYCASRHDGCFAEALAPFRVDPKMREVIGDEWTKPSFMTPGKIPRDWTTRHILVRLQLPKEARFLDVDDERTLETLSRELKDELAEQGVDRLTTEHIQGFNRRITRQISAWAITQRTGPSEQERLIHGIAYRSRFGMRQCWAVFNDVELKQEETSLIFPESEALRRVAEEYDLTML